MYLHYYNKNITELFLRINKNAGKPEEFLGSSYVSFDNASVEAKAILSKLCEDGEAPRIKLSG